MKSFLTGAALALAFVAAPAFAADYATTTPLSKEECTAEWTKCAGDMACHDALKAKGCEAPEATTTTTAPATTK